MRRPSSSAVTVAPSLSATKCSRRASQPAAWPKVRTTAPVFSAPCRTMSAWASAALTTAIPPGASPSKMAAFSCATPASPSAKASICTGPTVVTQAA